MSWSSYYANAIPDSDYVACRWRSPSGSGAWTYETEQLLTSDLFWDSEDGAASFAWPFFQAATFTVGLTVEVEEGLHRGSDAVVWGASLIDTMAAP
jgi:ribose 1,5-bisphosphokinase PhnN